MTFGIDLPALVQTIGVLGLLAIVFAESGLLVGFFLPGDSLLFTAGFLTHQGLLHINVHVLVGLVFVAAAFGDSVGYAFGRRVGHRIFRREDSLLFHKDNLRRAEEFYKKHGAMTIVLARFMPVIRTFAPIVAGVGKMDYKTFLIFNLGGGLLWAAFNIYLGYYVGAWFEARGLDIDHYLLPIIAVIILTSVAPPLYHMFKNPEDRKRLIDHLKNSRNKKR
jgi:membrane-associated protein